MPQESIWEIPMELITLRLSFQLILLCQTDNQNSEKGDYGSILNGRIAMVVEVEFGAEVEVGVEVEEEVQSEKNIRSNCLYCPKNLDGVDQEKDMARFDGF